jgi:hypothetical protein
MLRQLAALVSLAAVSDAGAQQITVEFTNEQPAGGFSTSPMWFGVHNGSFDFFNAGAAANMATEQMAELGMGDGLTAALGSAGVAGMVMTDPPVPQFTPGESGSTTMTIANAATNRWFSFASMVVPSNDFFIGNDNPIAYELFDSSGAFRGPLTIQVFGMDAWEAGTEVNDINNGIAFLVGRDPAEGTPEGGTVRSLFSVPGNAEYLGSIVGMDTPAYTVTDVLTGGELLATIRVVPGPGSAAAIFILALARRRSRRE